MAAASSGQPATQSVQVPAGLDESQQQLANALRESMVGIRATVPRDAPSSASLGAQRSGSGIVIEPQLILTIGYLILEAERVEVIAPDGSRLRGNVLAFDHATGFGLIRTESPLPAKPLPLGDSDQTPAQTQVLTIGYGEAVATPLFIAAKRSFVGGWEYMIENALYTVPAVNNWSGSALVDREGRLIGVGSLVLSNVGLSDRRMAGNLFVPINLLKPIYQDLTTMGRSKVRQPWIGVTTETVHGNLVVIRVAPGSPAERGGVQPGSIVVSVAGEAVTDQADFYKKLWRAGSSAAAVSIQLLQERQLKQVEVTPGDRNDFIRRPGGV